MLWLVGLAVVFRVAGGAARAGETPLGRLLGWALSACAAWLAAAAAGAFAPLGLALLAGLVFSLIDRFERRGRISAIGDALVVVGCGLASIPMLAAGSIASTAAAVALAGNLIDRALVSLAGSGPGSMIEPEQKSSAPETTGRARQTRWATIAPRAAIILLPLLLWIGHGLLFPAARAEFMREKYPQIAPALGPFFAIARGDVGERVELDTGAVAWLTLPHGPPPYRPALFFHGSDEEGAYQRGGLFIRRALVSLGYAVLAVDERGFGASPRPQSLSDPDAWDPLPTSLAAARYLESIPGVEGSVLAVGHSMGATRALRFLGGWPGASAGIVMGATIMPSVGENERFYGAFLDDYDLEDSGLDRGFVLEVRNRYFNNDAAVGALRRGHAPVLFFRFAFEYENIIEGREDLYAMIPGRKVRWELRADHQFGSSRVRGVLTGDWRTMRAMQRALGRFVDGFNPTTGAPMRSGPRR